MADKDARVRLNLAASGFASSMQDLRRKSEEFERAISDIGGTAEKTSRKTSGFFTAVKVGAGGARSALGELGGQLRNVLGMAATFGGALSIGGAARDALGLVKSYKDIAFAIRAGTGEAVTAAQVQQQVEATAGRWKTKTSEVRDAYQELFQETGNLKFTTSAVESVTKAHVASGKSIQTLTSLAGALNEKFNIPAEKMDDVLASAIQLGTKGGGSLEDFAANAGEMGAIAKMAGLEGADGFQRMAGILNIADGPLKNMRQSLTATRNLFAKLADPDSAKQIEKALGIKITDKSGAARADAMERILAKTKGQQSELAKIFSGQELRLVTDLGKNVAEAIEKTDGDARTKMAAGIEAYRKSLQEAGKATLSAADVQKEAAERLKDPERQLQDAINQFTKSFERPEIVAAIDRMAAAAPKLAGVFARLVGFAAENPVAAGAAVAGGVAAKGALTAVVTKVSESAMDSAGKLLGKGLESSWTPGGKAVGASFVAAAAAGGYLIGKQIVDYLLNKSEAGLAAIGDVSATAESMVKHGTGTPEKRAETAVALRKQIEEMEGAAPSMLEAAYSIFAPEGESTAERQGTSLARARESLRALESKSAPERSVHDMVSDLVQPKPLGYGSKKTLGDAMAAAAGPVAPGAASGSSAEARKIANEVATGERSKASPIADANVLAAAMARQLGNTTLRVTVTGGGTGTNGLPPAPGNGSGSTPR